MLRGIICLLFFVSSLLSIELKMNDFFDKNGSVMLLIDPTNGNIVRANQSASTFYGHTIEQLERMRIQDINTFTKEQVVNEMRRAKTQNRNYFIFRHKLDSGEIKRVEVYSHPIIYQGKKVLYSIIHDVSNLELAQNTIEHYSKNLEQQVDEKTQELMQTEKSFQNILLIALLIQLIFIIFLLISIKRRKGAEESLEKTLKKLTASEKEMREIINSFPISIIRAKNNSENIDFFNKSFKKLFKWSLDEIDTYDKWFNHAYPNEKYRKEVIKEWEAVVQETHELNLNTSKRPMLVHVAAKNGSYKECQVWYHRNENNVFGIFYDMTKQKELELENLSQQKMLLTQSKIAAVGEMLGNIAHQWRQPLSYITAKISGLHLLLDTDPNLNHEIIKKDFDDVMKQAAYLSQTIEDFKNFFTSDNEKIEEFNAKETVSKLHGLIKDALKNNYIVYHEDLESVKLLQNENRLIQACINICNNAKDAIFLNEIPSQHRHFFISLYKEDKCAILKFKDSAGGIKEDIIDKIFEPYFTTKHQSIGTGIGLYMTYQIVTANFQGTIEVKNVEYEYEGVMHKGAEFTLKLPIIDEK